MARSPVGPAVPRLHVVTDDGVLSRPGFANAAAALVAAGNDAVALHVRASATPGGRLLEVVLALREPTRASGTWLVVNDRVDVALAGAADGVQLGARSMAVAEARRLVGSERGVGVSVHAAAEAAHAAAEGADWLFAGTIYDTASHPGCPGQGAAFLAQVVGAAAGAPVLAIGGVTPERVGEVMAAGAAGVAVIRGIWDAPDPMDALLRYLEAFDEHDGHHGIDR